MFEPWAVFQKDCRHVNDIQSSSPSYANVKSRGIAHQYVRIAIIADTDQHVFQMVFFGDADEFVKNFLRHGVEAPRHTADGRLGCEVVQGFGVRCTDKNGSQASTDEENSPVERKEKESMVSNGTCLSFSRELLQGHTAANSRNIGV